jgi:hypothetical protein
VPAGAESGVQLKGPPSRRTLGREQEVKVAEQQKRGEVLPFPKRPPPTEKERLEMQSAMRATLFKEIKAHHPEATEEGVNRDLEAWGW